MDHVTMTTPIRGSLSS